MSVRTQAPQPADNNWVSGASGCLISLDTLDSLISYCRQTEPAENSDPVIPSFPNTLTRSKLQCNPFQAPQTLPTYSI